MRSRACSLAATNVRRCCSRTCEPSPTVRSDEFDAPVVRWAEDSSDSPIGVEYRYRCEASETPVDTYPFAEYESVPAATPNGAKGQIMPDRMLLRAVAMQTRDRHLDVVGADAAVEANEQFDSFAADPKEPVGPLGGDLPSAHTRRIEDHTDRVSLP